MADKLVMWDMLRLCPNVAYLSVYVVPMKCRAWLSTTVPWSLHRLFIWQENIIKIERNIRINPIVIITVKWNNLLLRFVHMSINVDYYAFNCHTTVATIHQHTNNITNTLSASRVTRKHVSGD